MNERGGTLVRYIVVGVGNVAVDLGILTILVRTSGVTSGPTFLVFTTLAFLAAILNGYYWSARWTFKVPLTPKRQLLPFALVQIVALVINDVVVMELMRMLTNRVQNPFDRIYAAKAVAIALTATWTFIASRFVIFPIQRGAV